MCEKQPSFGCTGTITIFCVLCLFSDLTGLKTVFEYSFSYFFFFSLLQVVMVYMSVT